MAQKSYGYCYDKQGNLKEVSAPVKGVSLLDDRPSFVQEVKSKPKTKTGALHNSVGFSASK